MDPWWVRNVIFYPREKDGSFTKRSEESYKKPETLSQREAFIQRCKQRGYADWKIDELWEKVNLGRKQTSLGKG